ncbi:capsular biosynthesis protein [Methylobacterium sp. BTF04]|uniref:capsular polysaccharide export protein, LipB/KpsS family n=1 Tax=Methylobacterium sp. BTF04 TaxID=2708300 RepID=UPI0013D6F2B6|nr:capsular biosynthesis protein [Methylobacterium sp. BTF04]NEU14789.1 capsular biosynthesis protein [Methylobacterium sp. BTF04]
MSPNLPPVFFSTGRTIQSLRKQVEGALREQIGGDRSPSLRGATGLVWGDGALAATLRALGRPPLIVEPGPLLSPYDTPRTGMASLRLRLAGRPVGGEAPEPATAERLRALRTFGRNRFLTGDAGFADGVADTPALILADGAVAASPRRLRAFIDRVLAHYPDLGFIIAGPEGCEGLAGAVSPRLRVLTRPVDPWALFGRVSRVFVADWGSACEARLSGASVTRIGADAAVPSDSDLLALRYGAGVHYFDPWTREPIALAECLERVAWLRDRFCANDRPTVLVGISRWKRPALDVFTLGPYGPAVHAMTATDAVAVAGAAQARVLAWATRMPERLEPLCAAAGIPLSRIEDGFLRSVGLGASLQPGASIVVDDRGIYYDPRTESRLAHILKNATIPADLVTRASALRRLVIARRLTKYNVGLTIANDPWPTDRRIVLVPGQVEDDASVMHGSPVVRSNRALLAAARARNPDAFLLYKPHPDVEAGFRPGAIPEDEALGLADRIVGGLSIVDLLDRAHHVETMTSLAGFEALIRGLTVAVHGRPFYAGWGLTEDLAPGADRGRRLALDELVAGALLLYPLYLDPVAMKPCSAEQLLDRLSAERDAAVPSRLALSQRAQWVMRARYAVLNPLVRRLRAKRGIAQKAGKTPE